MSSASTYASVLMVLLGAGACTDSGGPAPAADQERPPVPTTSASIALLNLGAAIDDAERDLERFGRESERQVAVDLHLSRFRVLNRLQDLDRAQDLADQAPDTADGAQIQAQVASARHRFEDAARWLDRAEELGADPAVLAPSRAANDIALGRPAQGLARLEGQPETFAVSFLRASALADLGRFDEADQAFVTALRLYRDVSPFPVAETAFRRGVMWSEKAGRPDLGGPLYEDGLAVLADHVTMTVHGSELVADEGRLDDAIARLERLVDRTDEPELFGTLGEYLALRDAPGDRDRAQQFVDRARAGYEQRLARHREAYLDHGSEFFRGPGGDLGRAVELALENLELRPTERAYLLAIEATEEAEDPRLCTLVQELADRQLTVADLVAAMDRLRPACSP